MQGPAASQGTEIARVRYGSTHGSYVYHQYRDGSVVVARRPGTEETLKFRPHGSESLREMGLPTTPSRVVRVSPRKHPNRVLVNNYPVVE